MVVLDPVRASEADKTRPAVVVSNDAANRTAARWPATPRRKPSRFGRSPWNESVPEWDS